MNKRSIFIISLIFVVLIAGDLIFVSKYFAISAKLRTAEATANTTQVNGKILDFTSAFITKVLEAKTEVDFETRLALETQVRDLNDADILAQWQKFTNSKSEADAQDAVKNLLQLLVSKIKK